MSQGHGDADEKDCRNGSVPAPVVIGGVGGSGTRLIARLMMDLGYFMGGDLNESLDNLWFTLLFKRPVLLAASDKDFAKLAHIFRVRMTGEQRLDPCSLDLIESLARENRLPEFSPQWIQERANTFITGTGAQPGQKWGWKEPNSHFFIERLRGALPGLKYIHVIRNGLDVAHSANQNQLRLWGPVFMGEDVAITPKSSLKFWRLVHERILSVGNDMGGDFFLLKYEPFCAEPLPELVGLLDFLGISIPPGDQERLAERVLPAPSIDRFKSHGIDLFDPDDVAFVAALGYNVEPERNIGRYRSYRATPNAGP